MKYCHFFFLLILLACQGNSATEEDTALAKDLCTCMKPMADINKKAERFMQQGKMSEVHALFNRIEQIAQESESCKKDLELKYGIIEGEKEERAHQAMRGQCSDIARMIARSKMMDQ